jgi:hypothetical protein
MKRAVRRLFDIMGYELRKKPGRPEVFHSDHYLRHNARRLEHLASLSIPVAGMTVLEVGAGIGDHSHYYLDRGCTVAITEAREENLAILRLRYPKQNITSLDLEHTATVPAAEVVHCYGLLYHLNNPDAALQFMSDHCTKYLFLETCVSFGMEKEIHLATEDGANPTQALSGMGCRPTRPWLFERLQARFEYVYCPKTQPNHEEFPLDWTAPEKHRVPLQRSVFIASRVTIDNGVLSPSLLDFQVRHE